MTQGLGMDIVDLDMFRAQVDDRASAFVQNTFTTRERRDSRNRPSKDPTQHLAARFAAKEAFLKAWSSTRFGRAPALGHVDLREIEVISDAWGRPTLRLHGEVARHVREAQISVSLTHDGGYAAAVVCLTLSKPSLFGVDSREGGLVTQGEGQTETTRQT